MLEVLTNYELALIDRVMDRLYDQTRCTKQCADIVAAISVFCEQARFLIINGDAVAGKAVAEGLSLICGRLVKTGIH